MRVASLFILVFIVGCLSCKNTASQSPACKTYLRELQEDWAFNDERNIFQINSQNGRRNQDFLSRLNDHSDCLKGLPVKKLRKIFGEPSRIEGARWKYYLTATCLDDEFSGCDFLDLTEDAEQGLVSIALTGQDLEE